MRFQTTLFLIFLFSSAFGFSQTQILGTVKDNKGEPLGGATVTLSPDSTGAILAYGISMGNGSFSVDFDSPHESVFIKVSYIGFESWGENLQNSDQNLEVVLKESTEELKEVMVEARIIRQRGDTLSFSVAAFKGQEDRVIADVLRKMPGIEIMPGGQIHYQGKPIQKYYIEGLDLLEGRYSLANNNISADDVAEVQILENHQPIKALDSLEFSERASLNIKLKKDVTISGTAEVGGGFSPLLWKTKITPMIFTKKQQAIVTYQANNTGSDVSREIRDFSITDFGREEFSIDKRDWLSIRQLAPPPFEQERWLDNNVHLGSVNYLIRLKNDMDLKTNISYLNDTQKQFGNTQTLFFTPTDTIDLHENSSNALFKNTLQSRFIMERNRDEDYFKNTLEVNGHWDSQRGHIITRNAEAFQNLSNPFSAIRNNLRMLQPLGKQLITFRSNTGYTQAHQNLRVNPGQFQGLLNNGEPYAQTHQMLESSTFFTDNSAGFTKGIKDFTIAPEIGFSIRNQHLKSRLGVLDEDTINYPEGDFRNQMDFLTTRIYVTNRLSYNKRNWNIRLITPLNYRSFDIQDAFRKEEKELSRLTFEPNLFVKKKISAFWEANGSASLSNDFRDFRSMYNGFILSDFRNMQRYDSPLPQSLSQSYSGRLYYRNPLNSIFSNAFYSYLVTDNNLLYSTVVGEGGTLLIETFEKDNTSRSHRMGAEISRHFRKINSTIDFGLSYSLSIGDRLLNNELTQVKNRNLSWRFGVESKLTNWMSVSYDGELSFLQTTLAERDFKKIKNQQHLLDLTIFPDGNQYFQIETEYYFNNLSSGNRNSYFVNLGYQYTLTKRKIDLAASWNNVLGTEEFVQVSTNEFTYVQSTYRLRPSQVLLRLKFSF